MAPTRTATARTVIGVNENVPGMCTRTKQALRTRTAAVASVGKRKACSPLKENGTAKRAAFGDITNAINKSSLQDKVYKQQPLKKVVVEEKILPTVKTIKQTTKKVNSKQINPPHVQEKIINSKEKQNNSAKSSQSDESEPSLYVSALDNISPVDQKEEFKKISEKLDKVVIGDNHNKSLDDEVDKPHKVPEGIVDFDRENWNDPFQVSHYAMDIFNYLKSRERLFKVEDYLRRYKSSISPFMRGLLVDWMVEVQESFELNHETLYLAVKLVDLTLSRSTEHTTKDELQLLGCAALFIACKFDERLPPLVDDFLYICDGAYTLNQLLKMEISVLKQVDFDLGIPLSYRFLRRYARCARVAMPLLTLARYILETCLLEYSLVSASDSKMAAAALYIALKMKSQGGWTQTLVYYTGYTLQEILPVALAQNATLRKTPKESMSTIRNKYSHKIFFSVAAVALIDDSVLKS